MLSIIWLNSSTERYHIQYTTFQIRSPNSTIHFPHYVSYMQWCNNLYRIVSKSLHNRRKLLICIVIGEVASVRFQDENYTMDFHSCMKQLFRKKKLLFSFERVIHL